MYGSIARLKRTLNNLILDYRHTRTFLGGTVKTRHASLGAFDIGNSDYGALEYIFKNQVGEDDVIVDVGCGKGRVIGWLLGQGYKNKIIGIELDDEISAKTKKTFAGYKNVQIINGNALENMPAEGTIFYLYNPFHEEVMKKFKDKIEVLCKQARREITILYYNCQYVHLFMDDPNWTVETYDVPGTSTHKLAIVNNIMAGNS